VSRVNGEARRRRPASPVLDLRKAEAIRKTGILYLDVEGGWGGSSRSLFYLVESLDRLAFEPVVLLRKKGPVEARYKELGVTCYVVPEMPSFRPADRKNAVAFAIFVWRLRKYWRLVGRIAPLIAHHHVGLIHVNHESLACVGALMARRFGLPWVGHVRTLLTPGWFARRVYRVMARHADFIIFITEPNRVHFHALTRNSFDEAKTSAIHNIVPVIDEPRDPLPALMSPADRFRVLSLTNFAHSRGVDRVIDVAAVLKSRGDQRFVFFLCGRSSQTSAITGRVDPYFEMLVKRAEDLGLEDTVFYPGHIAEPERALATCDALIKLTRQSNPWGRDIIEALSAGIPVLTLGTFQEFVENGVNGFIDETFDAGRIADHLVELASSEPIRRAMRTANRQKAKSLFNGPDRAGDIEAIYAGILRRSVMPLADASKETP